MPRLTVADILEKKSLYISLRSPLFNPQTGAKAAPSWQGDSQAIWLAPGNVQLFTGDTFVPALGGRRGPAGPPPTGTLKVTTTNMKPGYLRKNGVPYSANTVLTEYFDIIHEPDGTQYLIISSTVDDPANLTQPFRTSTHFKKEPNNSKFKPSACTAR